MMVFVMEMGKKRDGDECDDLLMIDLMCDLKNI